MSDIIFAGVPLSDDVRTEAVELLHNESRVVVVPVSNSSARPNPWFRLPKGIAWLVSDLFDWAAVVSRIPLSPAVSGDPLESDLAEAFGRGEVLVVDLGLTTADPRLPTLVPLEKAVPEWFLDHFAAVDDTLGAPIRSKTDLTALHAGILQMADHLTASHEHSQSIEGRGKHRAGDYWHAINHRREPDYGNAKYWFRHVGDHPLLAELGAVVAELAGEFSIDVRSKGMTLIDQGRLDPFRFVDLISEACRRKDVELVRFAERLQWIEMVSLLEWTLKDATS